MDEHSPSNLRRRGDLFRSLMVAGVGLVVAGLGIRAWSPGQVRISVSPSVQVVVLGSSIAMANVSADQLADELDMAPEAVAHLGERASQPAHWLALLRHQVARSAGRPTDVVVVTPLDVLTRERLRSDVDAERLLVLLQRPDPDLWTVAVGEEGRARFWGRQRAAVRRVLRTHLGDWLPTALGLSDALALARESASAVPRDGTDKPVWLVDPSAPRPGRANDRPERREPARGSVQTWSLVPQLAQEAKVLGATLWVVAPPVHPAERGAPCARSAEFLEVEAGLVELGIRVVDATDAPLSAEWFRSRYHLEGEGTARFTDQLARAIREQSPDWGACRRTVTRGGA